MIQETCKRRAASRPAISVTPSKSNPWKRFAAAESRLALRHSDTANQRRFLGHFRPESTEIGGVCARFDYFAKKGYAPDEIIAAIIAKARSLPPAHMSPNQERDERLLRVVGAIGAWPEEALDLARYYVQITASGSRDVDHATKEEAA